MACCRNSSEMLGVRGCLQVLAIIRLFSRRNFGCIYARTSISGQYMHWRGKLSLSIWKCCVNFKAMLIILEWPLNGWLSFCRMRLLLLAKRIAIYTRSARSTVSGNRRDRAACSSADSLRRRFNWSSRFGMHNKAIAKLVDASLSL